MCVTLFLPSWSSSPFFKIDTHRAMLDIETLQSLCSGVSTVDETLSFDLYDSTFSTLNRCCCPFCLMAVWAGKWLAHWRTQTLRWKPFPFWRHPWVFFVTPLNASHLKTSPTTRRSPAPLCESAWKPFVHRSIRTSMNMEVEATWGDAFWRAEKRRRQINTQEEGSVICDISTLCVFVSECV